MDFPDIVWQLLKGIKIGNKLSETSITFQESAWTFVIPIKALHLAHSFNIELRVTVNVLAQFTLMCNGSEIIISHVLFSSF